jgi:urease accessory protein
MMQQHSLPLMVWLSPSFPVGAFAFSHGLEWAVEAGDVHDRATACLWLEDLLHHGSGRTDMISVALAYKAARINDHDRLQDLTELIVAMQPSLERRLEALMQGQAFAAAIKTAWMQPRFSEWCESCGTELPYPVAFGLACAAHDLPLNSALRSYALAFVSNLVSAAIRLGPLGQSDGQRVLSVLLPQIEDVAAFCEQAELADLGGAAFYSDISSMCHETQYTRLFRS